MEEEGQSEEKWEAGKEQEEEGSGGWRKWVGS